MLWFKTLFPCKNKGHGSAITNAYKEKSDTSMLDYSGGVRGCSLEIPSVNKVYHFYGEIRHVRENKKI